MLCCACRLAAQKPQKAESAWAAVHNTLFGRHGIIPDVQNSCEWQAKLRAVQHDAPWLHVFLSSLPCQCWNILSRDQPSPEKHAFLAFSGVALYA